MEVTFVDDATKSLEKANAGLEPELLTAEAARKLLAAYARAERLAAYGVAALSRKLDDATALAQATGTSLGKAKAAYSSLLSGSGKGPARRPELVVVVSHGVAKRGWTDVRDGEVCKIPGVGPVAPQVARSIAKDAFLSGVFYDGKDLRQLQRWTRTIPVEVAVALELGDPPSFDGVACIDCGNRFKTEFDHVQPRAHRGPTSHGNLKPRCWRCHQTKTKRDRRAGLLRPPDP